MVRCERCAKPFVLPRVIEDIRDLEFCSYRCRSPPPAPAAAPLHTDAPGSFASSSSVVLLPTPPNHTPAIGTVHAVNAASMAAVGRTHHSPALPRVVSGFFATAVTAPVQKRLASVSVPFNRPGDALPRILPRVEQQAYLSAMIAHLRDIYPQRCSFVKLAAQTKVNELGEHNKRWLRGELLEHPEVHVARELGFHEQELGYHARNSTLPKLYDRADMKAALIRAGPAGLDAHELVNAYPTARVNLQALKQEGYILAHATTPNFVVAAAFHQTQTDSRKRKTCDNVTDT